MADSSMLSFIYDFYKFLFFFILALLVFHLLTRKYLNPYQLIMIFGKKGSGKTTLLTKLAFQHKKKGWKVYSTEDIPGTYKIYPKDIGYTQFPEGSVLLIDEVGMIWDNRNFKNFDTKVRDWFKLQRHYGCKVYLFSQTFDIDKKLRDLTDSMYLVQKRFRVFSYSKQIYKRTVLNKSSADGPSKIDEDLVFAPFILFWMGSRKFTYIPKYAAYFDSFEAPELAAREFEETPFRVPVKKRWRLWRRR